MTRLLLIEPHASGHHMQYVHRIIRYGSRHGLQIQLLTSQDSLTHPSYQTMQEELDGAFETLFLPSDILASRLLKSNNLYAKQLGYYRQFQIFFKHLSVPEQPDIIFIPYLDYIDKAVSVLGSPFRNIPWCALPMQYKFHYTMMGAFRPAERSDNMKKKMYLHLLNNSTLKCLFTIDELLYAYTEQYYPTLAKKLYYVGDPVDIIISSNTEEARTRLGLPNKDKIVLIYGALSLRKGVAEIIEATKDAKFPQQVSLLLAGAQYNDVRDVLNSTQARLLKTQGRLYQIDRFLSPSEESDVFRASDIVWLGYRDFYGMSGVMVQAGRMGLPIIACREGLIGWMVRKHQTGSIVNVANAEEIASAVFNLVSDSAKAEYYGANGSKLAISFNSEAFASTICTQLQHAAVKKT